MVRIAFLGGNRQLAVDIYNWLVMKADIIPDILVLENDKEVWRDNMKINYIGHNLQFLGEYSIKFDYIIAIHWHSIIPKDILNLPKHGCINLHPAYLPYNRGFHTPSWALYDGTPYGATLHFMDECLDHGDIIAQERIEILPEDTADSLYKRVMALEFELFKRMWPALRDFTYTRTPQPRCLGHELDGHKKKDLEYLQDLYYHFSHPVEEFINHLRALTTNDVREAAYFIENGQKYFVQVKITKESDIK